MKSKSTDGLLGTRHLAAGYGTALGSIVVVLLIACLAICGITAVHVSLPPGSSMPDHQPDTLSTVPADGA